MAGIPKGLGLCSKPSTSVVLCEGLPARSHSVPSDPFPNRARMHLGIFYAIQLLGVSRKECPRVSAERYQTETLNPKIPLAPLSTISHNPTASHRKRFIPQRHSFPLRHLTASAPRVSIDVSAIHINFCTRKNIIQDSENKRLSLKRIIFWSPIKFERNILNAIQDWTATAPVDPQRSRMSVKWHLQTHKTPILCNWNGITGNRYSNSFPGSPSII